MPVWCETLGGHHREQKDQKRPMQHPDTLSTRTDYADIRIHPAGACT